MTGPVAPRLFPIIGAPVAKVFSPPAFNAHFQAHGLACRMDPLEIPPAALDAFVQLLRLSPSFAGCSITYPHKQAAFGAVDDPSDRARRLGAVNTIRRNPDGSLSGDATDGAAMVAAVASKNIAIKGASARILGAGGGAGLAIVDAFCAAGLRRVMLCETDETRAARARDLVQAHWPQVEIVAADGQTPAPDPSLRADILVNATTLGGSLSDPLPFEAAAISAARVVCDVVTGPAATPLVATAADLGRITVTGADMGRHQLAPQLAFAGLNAARH